MAEKMTVARARERLEKCGWDLDCDDQTRVATVPPNWWAEARKVSDRRRKVVWSVTILTEGHASEAEALADLVRRVEAMERRAEG